MAKETTLKELGDMLSHIIKHMATKEDIIDVRRDMVTKGDFALFRAETAQNFRSIRSELTDANRSLDQIEEHYANLKGVTKEIDELRSRMSAIEKHLGITKKIVA